MARAKDVGNGRLQELLAGLAQQQIALMQHQTTLMQNQATFLVRAAEVDARVAEMDRINTERFARIEERFARIEERFARIEALLLEHNRILQVLPDVIRDKIGCACVVTSSGLTDASRIAGIGSTSRFAPLSTSSKVYARDWIGADLCAFG